jgi:hypothetical protein
VSQQERDARRAYHGTVIDAATREAVEDATVRLCCGPGELSSPCEDEVGASESEEDGTYFLLEAEDETEEDTDDDERSACAAPGALVVEARGFRTAVFVGLASAYPVSPTTRGTAGRSRPSDAP